MLVPKEDAEEMHLPATARPKEPLVKHGDTFAVDISQSLHDRLAGWLVQL